MLNQQQIINLQDIQSQHFFFELNQKITDEIITINFDHSVDFYLGDKDLLMKYYQNINSQLNGFEINTYSYQFPQKVIYQTPDELKIKVFGSEYQQDITEWHYIRYEIGYEKENNQPLFQIFSPDFDEIQQFRFPIQVQHFTGTKFLVILGGDEFTKKNMKGQTFDLMINFFCQEENQNFIIKVLYKLGRLNMIVKFVLQTVSKYYQYYKIPTTVKLTILMLKIKQFVCKQNKHFLKFNQKKYKQGKIQCSFGYFYKSSKHMNIFMVLIQFQKEQPDYSKIQFFN